MDKETLINALSAIAPRELARDLIDEFLLLRQDVATSTFGRSSPGKFVETLVQILQFLECGKFDTKPDVDDHLRNVESHSSQLDDGLRICTARIARAMYTLRNKRNIAHKGAVDPNRYDLRFLLSAAQWIVAELIRQATGIPMEEAGKLIDQIEAPVGGLVQDFEGRKLVLPDLTIREEVLVLLHSCYPQPVAIGEIIRSLDRRSAQGVRNALRVLWQEKSIEGNGKTGYQLTNRGFDEAIAIIGRCVEANGQSRASPSMPTPPKSRKRLASSGLSRARRATA